MKKKFIFGCIGFIMAACAHVTDGFVINGVIEGSGNGVAILSSTTKTGKFTLNDTVPLKNGRFVFKGKLDEPLRLNIVVSPEGEKPFEFRLFAENSAIELKGNLTEVKQQGNYRYLENVTVTGSLNDSIDRRISYTPDRLLKDPAFKEYADYRDSIDALRKAGNTEAMYKLADEKEHLVEHFRKESAGERARLVVENSGVIASAYYLDHFGTSIKLTELKRLYESLTGEVKNSSAGVRVKETITIRSNLLPGAVAPAFTLETPDGKKLSLSDLRGKYVLLDFWAYWCAPCRASFPELKKLYDKYKDKKFEILSISTDERKENWLKAIEDDQLPWKHVISGIEKEGEKITKLYAVPHIPYYFLIDPEGKIIAQPSEKAEIEAELGKIIEN